MRQRYHSAPPTDRAEGTVRVQNRRRISRVAPPVELSPSVTRRPSGPRRRCGAACAGSAWGAWTTFGCALIPAANVKPRIRIPAHGWPGALAGARTNNEVGFEAYRQPPNLGGTFLPRVQSLGAREPTSLYVRGWRVLNRPVQQMVQASSEPSPPTRSSKPSPPTANASSTQPH